MFASLTTAHWLTLHGLVTVVAVLIYVITSHLMHQRRHPTAAIAWILFVLLMPYVALPAYLTFGSRKVPRPRLALAPALATPRELEPWAIETVVALGGPSPVGYRELHLHGDGKEARDRLFETIDAAGQSLDICTFIFARDTLGTALLTRITDKALSGIRVRLLLDGVGRLMSARPDLRRFIDAGGSYTLFVPPFQSTLKGRTNLRNHRKMVIVDSATAASRLWCGGRNFADEYFEGSRGVPPWRDLSFDVRGPLVRQASALFDRDWGFAHSGSLERPVPYSKAASGQPDGAQIVASGPDQLDDTVYALLVTAAYRAHRAIGLVTPYFIPDAALLTALCLAARRGVSVDLLLPARSNHRLSDFARTRALRALAQAGGRVWLSPGMLHAKLAFFDDELALAGSSNLDSRSLFMNYEIMVAFHNATDVRRFAAWFDRERAAARPYLASSPGFLRDAAEGMLLWLGFQL